MNEVKYNLMEIDIGFAQAYFWKTYSTELSKDEQTHMNNSEKFQNLKKLYTFANS